MLIGTPFWALLIAKGWEWFFNAIEVPLAIRFRRDCVARADRDSSNVSRFAADVLSRLAAAAAASRSGIAAASFKRDYPMLLTSHPGVPYFMEVSFTNSKVLRHWNKKEVASLPAGNAFDLGQRLRHAQRERGPRNHPRRNSRRRLDRRRDCDMESLAAGFEEALENFPEARRLKPAASERGYSTFPFAPLMGLSTLPSISNPAARMSSASRRQPRRFICGQHAAAREVSLLIHSAA